MPTTTLLERVEKHIDRLDQALKESEDLLSSLRQRERDDWIRQLHERLAGWTRLDESDREAPPDPPTRPFYRS